MRCIKNTVHIKSCMKNQNLKKTISAEFSFPNFTLCKYQLLFSFKKTFCKNQCFSLWQVVAFYTRFKQPRHCCLSLTHTCTLVIAKNIYLWSVGTTGLQCTKLVHSTLKLLWMKYYNSPILSLYDCVNESLTLKILKVNKHKPQNAGSISLSINISHSLQTINTGHKRL